MKNGSTISTSTLSPWPGTHPSFPLCCNTLNQHNTRTYSRLARVFLPRMIERNSGSVITISSEAGYAPKVYLSLSHTTPHLTTVTLTFSAQHRTSWFTIVPPRLHSSVCSSSFLFISHVLTLLHCNIRTQQRIGWNNQRHQRSRECCLSRTHLDWRSRRLHRRYRPPERNHSWRSEARVLQRSWTYLLAPKVTTKFSLPLHSPPPSPKFSIKLIPLLSIDLLTLRR